MRQANLDKSSLITESPQRTLPVKEVCWRDDSHASQTLRERESEAKQYRARPKTFASEHQLLILHNDSVHFFRHCGGDPRSEPLGIFLKVSTDQLPLLPRNTLSLITDGISSCAAGVVWNNELLAISHATSPQQHFCMLNFICSFAVQELNVREPFHIGTYVKENFKGYRDYGHRRLLNELPQHLCAGDAMLYSPHDELLRVELRFGGVTTTTHDFTTLRLPDELTEPWS